VTHDTYDPSRAPADDADDIRVDCEGELRKRVFAAVRRFKRAIHKKARKK